MSGIYNSKIDYTKELSNLLKQTSDGNWYVVEDEDVDTVWISSDDESVDTIALLDYNGRNKNSADAHFIVNARNSAAKLLREVEILRQRVLDLLEENTKEVNLRVALQKQLNDLKEKK